MEKTKDQKQDQKKDQKDPKQDQKKEEEEENEVFYYMVDYPTSSDEENLEKEKHRPHHDETFPFDDDDDLPLKREQTCFLR